MAFAHPAPTVLDPGCAIKYVCPQRGSDGPSQEFFDAHRNKRATFLGHPDKLVGPLNIRGLIPGVYRNLESVRVVFDGEEDEHVLQTAHFAYADIDYHFQINPVHCGSERLGDLPHPILFFPDDVVLVRLAIGKKRPDGMLNDDYRLVCGVFLEPQFVEDGIPQYQVLESEKEFAARKRSARANGDGEWPFGGVIQNSWKIPGTDLQPVERGNVWWLYHDPSRLRFQSPKEELHFWARSGISRHVPQERLPPKPRFGDNIVMMPGERIEIARAAFHSGAADFFVEPDIDFPPSVVKEDDRRYLVMQLLPCFSGHRARVRALMDRMLAQTNEVQAA